MLTIRNAAAALLLFLSPALVSAQTAGPEAKSATVPDQPTQQSASAEVPASPADAGAQSTFRTVESNPAPAPTPVSAETDGSELKQTRRIFGLVPNYTAVSARAQVPPLTAGGKFNLAMHDSVDYSSFILVALLSGESMVMKSYPEFHQGIRGYGRYYWRAFADQTSGTFFTEAIVPALTHEDPRYYTLGHGGFRHRTMYAVSRVVVTRTDSGGSQFNYSEIVGNGLEAGLSNLYYPERERTFHHTLTNWATMTLVTGVANVLKEFWPDIRNHLPGQK